MPMPVRFISVYSLTYTNVCTLLKCRAFAGASQAFSSKLLCKYAEQMHDAPHMTENNAGTIGALV